MVLTRIIYVCTSNVCRSPIAEAIAKEYTRHLELDHGNFEIVSRGITGSYSPFGSGANSRMLESATNIAHPSQAKFILDSMSKHSSRCLSEQEIDDRTVIFLVTREHEEWIRHTVGDALIDKAKREGRLRMIHSDGVDIYDPYFGNQKDYDVVCKQLLEEVPITLKAAIHDCALIAK